MINDKLAAAAGRRSGASQDTGFRGQDTGNDTLYVIKDRYYSFSSA